MLNPQSHSEQLLFTTVRLQTDKGTGTGFFYNITNGKDTIPLIVTNKHVVGESKEVDFFLHIKGNNNEPSENNFHVKYITDWIPHPTLDLCCTFVAPLLHQIKANNNFEIFFKSLDNSLIWDDLKLKELLAVEDVLMVGYPIGLWDEKNNLPLIRKGITSTHPCINFNGNSIGVIDAACFPGSSGSPILVVNEGMYGTKQGTNVGSRAILLGVLFSGPQISATGEIKIEQIPTQQKIISDTKLMINLGYYIKAKEIKVLEDLVKQRVGK